MKPVYKTIESLFETLELFPGMGISFHHHLRNGDETINRIMDQFILRDIQKLSIYPSSIFPVHTGFLKALENGQIENITTSYINGPVADYLGKNGLKGSVKMQTHGGRARAFIEGENTVDIAFIAAPAVDRFGNASGVVGPSACGSLGYAVTDSLYAKKKVLITDTLVDALDTYQIEGKHIDAILVVDTLGNRQGIVSGTTTVTRDPIGQKIARNAYQFLLHAGVLTEGLSFQSGAGGVSLRVSEFIKNHLQKHHLTAKFISGGITKYHVDMLKQGLVEDLYDVQCFDLVAVQSLAENAHHHAISADVYANPNNPDRVIKALDIVILGATEIDLDFNVNVTTDSYNTIIGGSGGHSDTATDAKITVIVSPLFKARTPIIKEMLTTKTTLGKHIDCLVTERGIAINPLRQDLIERFKDSSLDIVPIKTLLERAHAYTGIPRIQSHKNQPIGVVEDRDGTIIDTLYSKR